MRTLLLVNYEKLLPTIMMVKGEILLNFFLRNVAIELVYMGQQLKNTICQESQEDNDILMHLMYLI